MDREMTTEERKAIIDRPWTFEEAQAASRAIQALDKRGSWQDSAPVPQCWKDLAYAVMSHPAGTVSLAQARIIAAYEEALGL
jgi:hypothetical protein